MGPKVLFNGQHIYDLVEIQKDRLKKAYDALPDDKALDEAFTQDFKRQFMLDIPKLRPEEWTSEQREIPPHSIEIIAYVPFDGDPEVFNIRPSAFNGSLAQGEIVGHELLIHVRPQSPDFDVVAFVKREIGQIEWRLNSLRGTMEHMSQTLEIGIRESIATRKRSVEHKAKIGQNIGIPRRQPPPVPAPSDSNPVATPKPELSEKSGQETWNIFMSHASPDKPWVRGLVKALRAKGVTVWFDEDSLEWGEDLQRGINRGLINSRKAIAVLSKSYLAQRKWTEAEISGFLTREKLGETLILPIWHQITEDDLKRYNLILASRIAKVSDSDNYGEIVRAVLKVLGRGHDAIRTNDIRSPGIVEAEHDSDRRELMAFAWYETKDTDARRTKRYVRRSGSTEGWYVLIDERTEHEGPIEDVSEKFLTGDRSLKNHGYLRTHYSNPSNSPMFEL